MGTPNGTTIRAVSAAGDETDVTEAVQVLYDLVVQSMDWGSGFLSVEDVVPVYRLAELCGFGESPREYLIGQRVAEKQQRWVALNRSQVLLRAGTPQYKRYMDELARLKKQWRAEAEAELG